MNVKRQGSHYMASDSASKKHDPCGGALEYSAVAFLVVRGDKIGTQLPGV
jgi:hypothetical protein